MTFLQISSTAMTARPLSSCPVTTRLIFSAIPRLPKCDPRCCPRCVVVTCCNPLPTPSHRVTFVLYTIKLRLSKCARGRTAMKRSSDQILTPHVGSLPRPADLLDVVQAKEQGKPVDAQAHATRLRAA